MWCGRDYIVVEDLHTLLPEEKTQKAFEMFDANLNGKVSQSEVHQAVLQIFTCASTSVLSRHPVHILCAHPCIQW